MKGSTARMWLAAAAVVGVLGCAGGTKSKPPKEIPKDASYSVRLAKSLYDGGRVSEALAELEQAVAREPDNASLLNTQGSYLLRAARYPDSITAFNRALAIDPYMTDAHNNLGFVYTQIDSYAEAEAAFRKALADPAYPTPYKVWFNLGQLYLKQGRWEDAVAAFRQAVGIDPDYYPGHFELASVLDRIGNLVEAVREYEVAEPAYRNSGEYWYRRGFAHYRLGQHSQARDVLARVRSVAPGSEASAKAEEILKLLE